MGSGRTSQRLIALALAVLAPVGAAAAGCSADTVEIRGPSGSARFTVQVADSVAERARGLMFREAMPSAAGMLFVYPRPQHASFWMKNTLIPLDMIFADAAGRVTLVHAKAKPKDLSAIDGGEGVAFVLEINGGLAARLGIVPGSELRNPVIDPAKAAWPCDQ